MKVFKRNGVEVDYDFSKIVNAVSKANNSVKEQNRMTEEQLNKVAETVQKRLEKFDTVKVEDIQDIVEASLVKHNKYEIAKAYILFRQQKKDKKKYNDIEEKFKAIASGESAEARGDNANKHIDVNSSMRDYEAGTVSKSLFEKDAPKEIVVNHKNGKIHWHDSDYFGLHMHNCFDGETEFVTEFGLKKFKEFKDGQIVHVLDKDGLVRKATVHEYEKQYFNTVTFATKNGKSVKVTCTPNHRWILSDNSVTTNLSIGDRIALLKKPEHKISTTEQARAWTYGFLIGDGCDHGKYCQVRLCGSKNKYVNIFNMAGIYTSYELKDSGDIVFLTKFFNKQDFLNNKSYFNMPVEQKIYLFEGLFAADKWNDETISVNDSRVADLIRNCAPISGYNISSEKEEYYDTNFKKNAHRFVFRFMREMKESYGYIVKSIEQNRKKLKKTYCVSEPVTHTFTLSNGLITGNCDLVNLKDCIENGFMMGDTWIDTPKRFSTGCNLGAQIALIFSGSQYGGQTMSWSHLLPLIRSTFDDCKVEVLSIMECIPKWKRKLINAEKYYNEMTDKLVKRDIHVGIKTYQYQILCHHSSNGQTPFVSNVLCLREAQGEFETKWLAFIIEEILKKRMKGVKDKSGHYVSPLFPKLLYFGCEGLNVEKTDPYYYLTKLAAKVATIRLQPDYNSEKKVRESKSGQIIPSMGCRSWLSPIWEENTYPVEKAFEYQFIDESNVQYKGAPGKNFNYKNASIFGSLKEFNTEFASKNFVINFAGNSGWVKEITNKTITVIEPKVYGRWNNGVITVNIPYAALEARRSVNEEGKDKDAIIAERKQKFYEIFGERLELCHRGLIYRNNEARKIRAKNAPLLWMYGGLYRTDNPELTLGEIMDKYPTRYSISLGFVGLFETCVAICDSSNTSEEGIKFCKEVLTFINDKLNEWKKADTEELADSEFEIEEC